MDMYKIFSLWFVAVCLLGFSVWADDVVEPKTIVKIATEEYPPYTSKNLKHNGIDCHIIREAFALEGVDVVFRFYPGARAYMMAKSGQADATVPWAKRKGREDDFYFSDALIASDTEHFYFLKGTSFDWDPTEQDYNHLKGLRIGAVISYNYGEEFQTAEESGLIHVERVSTVEQNFKKLLLGKVDLVICQNRVGMHILQTKFTKNDIKKINHHPQNSDAVEYDYLLFTKKKKTSHNFLELFNKGLKKLKSSGKYDQYLTDLSEGKYLKD